MWKFQDFSIIQILREINFTKIYVEVLKLAIFAILGELNFIDLVTFSLQKVQQFRKIKIQSL